MTTVRWSLLGTLLVALSSAAALVVSCGPRTSSITFIDDYANAYCDRATVCLWPDIGDDFDACYDAVSESMEDIEAQCSDFNSSLASDCLAEIRGMTCDQGLNYLDPDVHPFSCRSVYDCYGT